MSGYVKIDDIIEGLRDDNLVIALAFMSADQRVDAFMKGLKKEYSVFRNSDGNKPEPQTASLTSAHISGDIYHKVKDEPQTDCETCKHTIWNGYEDAWDCQLCDVEGEPCHYEPKQTEREGE